MKLLRNPVRNSHHTENLTNKLPGRSYYILDNGGRPFLVNIKGMHVEVYPLNYDEDNYIYEKPYYKNYKNKPIHQVDAEEIFIGKASKKIGAFRRGYLGNSILLKIKGNNKYQLIYGDKIINFSSKAPINSYVSPIGNADVVYPFAVDDNQNYYIFAYGVMFHYSYKLEDEEPYKISERLGFPDTTKKLKEIKYEIVYEYKYE